MIELVVVVGLIVFAMVMSALAERLSGEKFGEATHREDVRVLKDELVPYGYRLHRAHALADSSAMTFTHDDLPTVRLPYPGVFVLETSWDESTRYPPFFEFDIRHVTGSHPDERFIAHVDAPGLVELVVSDEWATFVDLLDEQDRASMHMERVVSCEGISVSWSRHTGGGNVPSHAIVRPKRLLDALASLERRVARLPTSITPARLADLASEPERAGALLAARTLLSMHHGTPEAARVAEVWMGEGADLTLRERVEGWSLDDAHAGREGALARRLDAIRQTPVDACVALCLDVLERWGLEALDEAIRSTMPALTRNGPRHELAVRFLYAAFSARPDGVADVVRVMSMRVVVAQESTCSIHHALGDVGRWSADDVRFALSLPQAPNTYLYWLARLDDVWSDELERALVRVLDSGWLSPLVLEVLSDAIIAREHAALLRALRRAHARVGEQDLLASERRELERLMKRIDRTLDSMTRSRGDLTLAVETADGGLELAHAETGSLATIEQEGVVLDLERDEVDRVESSIASSE